MRASELIAEIEEMIKLHGDRYMVYESEGVHEMENVEELTVVPHYETKYFCIK